ncbi:MAG: DUF6152 family protein [Acidobacteriota bacterium]
MRLRLFSAALATVACLPAQYPFRATYDGGRTIRLQGAVTRVEWVNPRAYVFIDDAVSSANWAVEIGNPIDLERDGWSRNRLKIGDEVAVVANPGLGTRKVAFAKSFMRGNEKLFTDARPALARPQPAPRGQDGRVILGPPAGQRGYWSAAKDARLAATTGALPMDADGLLRNLADADRVAPFQPWARDLYKYRQANLLRDDPAARCIPAGGPRQFQTANGFQFIEQRELGRILVLLGGSDRNWRIIYTDGRPQGQPDEVVLGYYGSSVGKWDGDTLVVDTVGFNEGFWFAKGGLPHTEALHLTERFSRPNLNTLRYDVTVDDARTYTRPWTAGWTAQWVADKDIEEFFCEENVESTFER